MKRVLNVLQCSFLCLLSVFIFFSCSDDDPAPDVVPANSGVYILNQGSWGQNNSGITYFDFEAKTTTFDLMKGTLGENAVDMKVYGSKMYVTVSGSSVLAVYNLQNKSLIRRVNIKNGNEPREPRYLAFNAGKVYVSTYDGNVVRIDTMNYEIEAVTKAGPNPEGIAYVNGKLYVANSGGMVEDNKYNNTVSVVDVATFKEEKTITVGVNPNLLQADSYGDLYLTYKGNYDNIPAGFQRIDTKTNTVYNIENVNVANFTILGDLCYFYGIKYNDDWSTSSSFGVFNIKTETLTSDPLISDGTKINTAYGIGINPVTKDVYISDTDYQNPGTVCVFGTDGKKINTIEAGINACQFVFY